MITPLANVKNMSAGEQFLPRASRVLFLQSEAVAAEARIRPLLGHLRSENCISGYAVVDRDMAISGDLAEHYDVALTHRNPSTRQMAWLRQTSVPFVYDIDDLLLDCGLAGSFGRRGSETRSIAWCLAHAQCITAPARRLVATLEARIGASFGHRGVLVLNAGTEAPPPKKDSDRPRLLWVSSSAMPAHNDILCVCQGIEAARRAIDTDILLVGRFAPDVLAHFQRREQIAWLPHHHYRKLLAEGPFIAIAPLPMTLPPEQQAFIDCKSDIKAAEYGSSGIEAVYSPGPPYTESDLPCCIAPANTAAAWQDRILDLAKRFPSGGNALAENQAFRARRPSVIALRFLAALAQARNASPKPFGFRATPTPALFRSIERNFRKFRSRLLR